MIILIILDPFGAPVIINKFPSPLIARLLVVYIRLFIFSTHSIITSAIRCSTVRKIILWVNIIQFIPDWAPSGSIPRNVGFSTATFSNSISCYFFEIAHCCLLSILE